MEFEEEALFASGKNYIKLIVKKLKIMSEVIFLS